jgi:lysophospholipase L1-like esterase
MGGGGSGGETSTPDGGDGAGGTSEGGAGGESAGGAGGSGEDPSGFQPCPEGEPCKILPLGDSITFGLGFDGGYRVELFRLALEGEHDITFTGTQSPNGPNMVDGVTFPRNHGGISGQTISQIAGRIPNPELGDMPHIILVHAGTNDMNGQAQGASDRLGDLMDKLIEEAPDALLVFSNIIPFNNSVPAFNETVPGMVEERAAAGAHIIFVDQYEGFPNNELGDGVHPNEAGYARMASKWYEAIEEYLP